jgi:leucyl aminopeptidase
MTSTLLKNSVEILSTSNILEPLFDGVIVVSHSFKALKSHPALSKLFPAVETFAALHKNFDNGAVSLVPHEGLPSKRLIYSSTGSVTKDFDDVRRYLEAGKAGIKSALSYGVKSPLIITVPSERFANAELIAAIGALHPLYVPLHVRQEDSSRAKKVDRLAVFPISHKGDGIVKVLNAVQSSFTVCRDVGDTDPQRMAPPKTAEYIQDVFKGTSVKVRVEGDVDKIRKEYPLMSAVNRCANQVEAHKASPS